MQLCFYFCMYKNSVEGHFFYEFLHYLFIVSMYLLLIQKTSDKKIKGKYF